VSTAAGDRSAHDQKGQAHAGHAHVSSDTNARRLSIALALIVGFMAAEVIAGILAHSLALFEAPS
jgi:cobalt-zinc-cadmium efflux system protein